jgi:hypothetical protein
LLRGNLDYIAIRITNIGEGFLNTVVFMETFFNDSTATGFNLFCDGFNFGILYNDAKVAYTMRSNGCVPLHLTPAGQLPQTFP